MPPPPPRGAVKYPAICSVLSMACLLQTVSRYTFSIICEYFAVAVY